MSVAGCRTGVAEKDQAEPELTSSKPVSGGRLAYGIEADPNGLDPTRNAFDPVGLQVANAIYDPIAAFDAAGVVQPYLAQSFEPADDFRRWTVRMREGVRFHDGTPLDAAAALAHVKAIRESPITGGAASYIAGAEADGPLAVVITMSQPWATFPALLTAQGGYMVSPNQAVDPGGHSRPIGTGPFRLDKWDQQARISLVRNPDYWRRGLPYLDAVDFVVVPDGEVRVAGLGDGSIDVTTVTNISDVRALDTMVRSAGGGGERIDVVRDSTAADYANLMFNTAQAPFDNVHARRAVAYATDVDGLASANDWERETLAGGPFPAGSRWHAPTNRPSFDLDRARREVADYKAATGRSELTFEIMGAFEPGLLQQMTEQWSRAGIKASINLVPFTQAVPRAVAGFYQALQFRYFSSVDPDILWHFWTSKTSKPMGGFSLNFTRLADDQIEVALDAARGTTDEEARRKAYATVQERLADLVPYVWLARVDSHVASAARVHDARNVSLPDGTSALPYVSGTHRLTETWVEGTR